MHSDANKVSAQQSDQAVDSYREGHVIHDADSHIIEFPGWLESYCSDYVKGDLLPRHIPMDMPALQPVLGQANNRLEGNDPDLTDRMKADLFGAPEKRNLFAAFGASEKKERSESLDLVGISSQLVFPTIALTRFTRTPDLDVIYGGAEGLNLGMADFCSGDPRLLAVGHVPLSDPKRAIASLKLALDLGVRTIWLRSDAMNVRAPSHRDYGPLWAMMEEACMIYHGVLDRFPKLKIGMIKLGANWVPAMIQNLDIGKFELDKFDCDLKALKLKSSEYVTRQVR
jgi:predicted TIM-barrel fold metal-dependent hydrolase